jgi:hypothetical protein
MVDYSHIKEIKPGNLIEPAQETYKYLSYLSHKVFYQFDIKYKY